MSVPLRGTRTPMEWDNEANEDEDAPEPEVHDSDIEVDNEEKEH